MELSLVMSLLGSIAVLYGLLKAHHFVVEKHLLPEIEPEENPDE